MRLLEAEYVYMATQTPKNIMIASETEGLTQERLQVGVIGAGAIAQRFHIPRYQGNDHADLVAICDAEEKKAAEVAKHHDVPEYFVDHTELLDSDALDAVSVCLPNHLHKDVVCDALDREIDVLCEKPISTSLAEADAMVESADRNNSILMVNQTERFNPVYEKAREILEKGMVGDVINVRSRFSHPGPEGWSPRSTWFMDADASGGGALVDIGIHNADLVNYLFSPVSELVGFSETVSMDTEVEDTAVACLRFDDGSLGTFETAWRTDPESIEMQIVGEEGVIYLDNIDRELRVEFGDDSGTLSVPVPDKSKHGGSLNHFVESVRNGTEPVVTGRDGRRALEIIMAIYRSSDTGCAVSFPLESGDDR